MQTTVKGMTPFLEKISKFNFGKFYTLTNRILSHSFMWLFFSLLFFLNFWVELQMPLDSSLVMTMRGTINNITVFYIFFYLIVPIIFKSKGWSILLISLSIIGLIYIWLTINFLQYNILNYFGIDVLQGPLQGIIDKNASQTYSQALSNKNVLGNAMLVIYSFSPPFFVKILFDMTKLFSRTIYFQKQTSQLEMQNLNIEKDFLKSQLNPHFLFNTLNNLYGLVVKNDPSAPDTIINLSDMMAYTLYESNTDKVPIEKELDFIRNYFYLERMRYSEDKDINLNIDVSDDIEETLIAPLLTFTFIENAFKYGLKSKNNNYLRININIANNIFYFSVENNKEETSKKIKDLGGIGVKNIRKRLKLIYPQKHTIHIEDKGTSFLVSLLINLK